MTGIIPLGEGTSCCSPDLFAGHMGYGSIRNIPVDLSREELHELGRRGPYHRFIQFPVEITEEIIQLPTGS
jgi:hypothetical protein